MSSESSSSEELLRLRAEVERLAGAVRDQSARLEILEGRVRPGNGRESEARRPEPGPARESPPPQAPPPAAPEFGTANARPARDLESRIGGSWFNRIGIVAVTLGVGFFLKYAFDNEWIGARGRVGAGFAAGLGFLLAGDRLRARGYQHYANGLAGGGLLMLYLSVAAAFAYYELIGPIPAFALFAGITAAAVLLAARFQAQAIAGLGLIGGFVTPLILPPLFDRQIALFTYLAVLDAGVLALAYRRGWRGLNYAALLATVTLLTGWMAGQDQTSRLGVTFFYLTLFFVIFTLIVWLNNVVRSRPMRWLDAALVLGNTSYYFGASYFLLENRYHSWLSLHALALAAFYVWFGEYRARREPVDKLFFYTMIGVAIVLATLALPIQLGGQWLTTAWAVEGAVLTWIGLKARNTVARYWALPLFAIAAMNWCLHALDEGWPSRTAAAAIPLWNARGAAGAVIVAALAASAYLYRREGEWLSRGERDKFAAAFGIGANLGALVLL
ncbi:MAG TPA: DUF2339 domain-containing protein, partial [Pyrinomonadaceae bacterium]|nr:DUF2339 domain-containing protein [Pyrinomonadaceae bacterium]